MSDTPHAEETYSEEETARRRDDIVRRMIATPPTPKPKPKTRAESARKSLGE